MTRELVRIAYVEDEPDIRELTEMSLTAIGGFEVEVYASGREALARIEAFGPDMILLDVMMPEMDGPELLGHLSRLEAVRHTPVAFITAKSQEQEIEDFKRIGAVGVISKPYDPLALPDMLRTLWAGAADAA